MDASRAVAVGDADVVLAGGVEAMSRAPWVLPKPSKGYPTGHEQLWSTTLGWRMTNPLMPTEWTISLGEGAEVLADKYSISREAQDEFAFASHQKAAAAWDAGWFADEIIAVAGRDAGARRVHPGRLHAGEAGHAQAGLPRRWDGDGGQRVADERRRGRAGPGIGGRRPAGRRVAAGPRGVPRHQWCRAAPLRHRSGRGRPPGAGPGRARLGRPVGRGAQRGLRRAEPGLPGRVARARPRHRQPARAAPSPSGIRWAARAPASSPPSSTTCGAPAAAMAWPRCASGSARASPSSSRTPSEGVRNREREHHARCPPGRGPGHVLG